MKNTASQSEEKTSQAGSGSRPRRPLSVSLLILGVLIIASGSLVRFILSIRQWEFLAGFSGVSPAYLAASGLIWALACLPLLWGLFFRRFWGLRCTRLAVVAYVATIWLESGVLSLRHGLASAGVFPLPDSAPDLVFQAVGSALLLFVVFLILSRKNVKAYFGVNHER